MRTLASEKLRLTSCSRNLKSNTGAFGLPACLTVAALWQFFLLKIVVSIKISVALNCLLLLVYQFAVLTHPKHRIVALVGEIERLILFVVPAL